MHCDLARVAHHLVVLIHIRCPEVDQDINNEHDVDCQVDDRQRVIVTVPYSSLLRAPPALLFVQEERGDVRREDGRVDDQYKDEPVPDGLER